MAKIDPDAKLNGPSGSLRAHSLRTVLEAVIEEYAQNAGTDFMGAFRDALTDLKHIADEKEIDFDETVIVALEVAAQETEKHIAEAVPDPLKTEYFTFAGGSFYKIEGGIVSAYFQKYKTWEPIPDSAGMAEWVRKNMTKINDVRMPTRSLIPDQRPEAGGPNSASR